MSQTLSPAAAYNRRDWQNGYQSQRRELDCWVTDIEGTLPPELRGTLFRNGPGLLDIGGVSVAHPFDGDGLIGRITFVDGRVHFSDRFVRTAGYVAEEKAGKPLYRGVFGTQKQGGWLANCFDLKLKNIANTHVIYWGDRLLALWEAAQPHRLDPSTLATVGLDHLDGLLGESDAFAAHPRIDPGSSAPGSSAPGSSAPGSSAPGSSAPGSGRRLVNFAVQAGLSTSLKLYEFAEDGQLLSQQTRTIPGFAFLHDFAITPHYAIFFQNPVRFNPLPFLFGLRGAGQCVSFDPGQPTRAIVIPRDPAQPVQTLETDPGFVFHHANAYETPDGHLVVDSVCYDSFPTLDPAADFLDVDFDQIPAGSLWRSHLNLQTQTLERTCLEPRCCEFPSLHPRHVGQPYRYVYLAAAHHPTGNAPLQGLTKLDLETGDRQFWSLAPRGFATEPVFVPRPGGTAEDDGWVLMLSYNAERHCSDVLVFAAPEIDRGPVATIHLPIHLPYGLHGSFVEQVFLPSPDGAA